MTLAMKLRQTFDCPLCNRLIEPAVDPSVSIDDVRLVTRICLDCARIVHRVVQVQINATDGRGAPGDGCCQ